MVNWFHAAIPTYTVALSSLVQLEDIFVFFKTGGPCQMEEIQVWDGAKSIQVIPLSPAVAGDFTLDPIPGVNAFNIRERTGIAHTMNYGLNVGMKVNFTGDSEIQFFSASVSFITSD